MAVADSRGGHSAAEYIEVLGMRNRVRVALDQDHVGVWAAEDEALG